MIVWLLFLAIEIAAFCGVGHGVGGSEVSIGGNSDVCVAVSAGDDVKVGGGGHCTCCSCSSSDG